MDSKPISLAISLVETDQPDQRQPSDRQKKDDGSELERNLSELKEGDSETLSIDIQVGSPTNKKIGFVEPTYRRREVV